MSHQIDVEKVLLQKLMDESPDYVFIKDRLSRFVIINQAQARLLFGLENPNDVIGKTDFDLFPGKREDAQRFYDEEQFIMQTGQPVIRREWMVPSTATRNVVWLSESKLPIKNESGVVIGVIGIGRDITVRKTAQLLTEKLSHQLETAVQVARIASSILDPYELTQQIVDLVRDRFGFYYVGLFLVDQTQQLDSAPGEYAVLRAATGEEGQTLVNQGYKLKVGEDSIVGQCIATCKPCIKSEKGQLADVLLRDVHTEMAFPLVSRQEIIGALDVQLTVETPFTEQDVSVFEVLSSLLSISIQNAFLFKGVDAELEKTKRELQTYVRTGWGKQK